MPETGEKRAPREKRKAKDLMLRSCSALSRALGRSAYSTRAPLCKLHTRTSQTPYSLSHWSEPTGDGLVPIVVEQTVRVWCVCPYAVALQAYVRT
jgi:hypothetical protein